MTATTKMRECIGPQGRRKAEDLASTFGEIMREARPPLIFLSSPSNFREREQGKAGAFDGIDYFGNPTYVFY